MNGLKILNIPQLMNLWVLFGVSVLFVLILGSLPVDWIYTNIMGLITFLLFKREKKVEDEGLEDEYDNDEEDRFEILAQRRMAIEELAATLDTEEKETHGEGQS